jgi:hypothetical protein
MSCDVKQYQFVINASPFQYWGNSNNGKGGRKPIADYCPMFDVAISGTECQGKEADYMFRPGAAEKVGTENSFCFDSNFITQSKNVTITKTDQGTSYGMTRSQNEYLGDGKTQPHCYERECDTTAKTYTIFGVHPLQNTKLQIQKCQLVNGKTTAVSGQDFFSIYSANSDYYNTVFDGDWINTAYAEEAADDKIFLPQGTDNLPKKSGGHK